MLIDLSSARSRCSFLFLVVLSAGEFSFLAAKVWLAEQWNESSNPKKWLAAAQLEPGNGQYSEQLGLYDELNLERRDESRAAYYLRRAAQVDPRSERPWLELAALDEERGDFSAAKQAYEMAQSDFPISPDVAWRYGSFLLRRGDFSAGFVALRRAIDKDPSLEASALAESWAVDPNADSIADAVLPQKAAYYVRAIRYFLSQKQTDAALVIWTHLLKLNQPVAMRDSIDLIDDLISEGRISKAHQVWFVDRDHFAGFIELTAPFGLAMLLHGTRRGEKAALVALFTAVPIAALVLCGSRGGIVGFAVAILFLILISRRRNIGVRQLFALASLILLCGALVFWFGAGATMQRFGALTVSDISRDQRVSMDRDTFRIFRDHYITGTGLGTLETVFPQYETNYTGRVVDHAHNDYLELLAETGVIGGLLGLAFIVLLFRQGFANLNSRERQSDRAFYAGALAACSALLVHSFVDFNLHVPANALLFLLLATLASAGKQLHDSWRAEPTGRNWQAEKARS